MGPSTGEHGFSLFQQESVTNSFLVRSGTLSRSLGSCWDVAWFEPVKFSSAFFFNFFFKKGKCLIVLFSSQNAWQRPLKEGRVSLGSWSEGTVRCGREGLVARAWGRWSLVFTVGKEKRQIPVSVTFLFLKILSGIPAHRIVSPHSEWVFPAQLDLSRNTLTDTPRDVSPGWFLMLSNWPWGWDITSTNAWVPSQPLPT